MLTKSNNDVGEDRSSCFENEDSVYSLVSEAKSNDLNLHKHGASGSDSNANANANGAKLGLLILDGAEDEDGHGEENRGVDDKETSTLLSVPDTVFLPSEIRSVVAGSCIDQEQDSTEAEVNQNGNNLGNAVREMWMQISSLAARWASSVVQNGSSNRSTMQMIVTALLVFILMASSAWRSHVWKHEALRLREDLQRQKALIPYTLSLLKEREALIEKQIILELEIEHAKKSNDSGGSNYYEDVFPPDKADDESFLSIKNCYVEASLSLGQCSKEWQRWWSESGGGTEDVNEDSYEDGFTNDMSKLVNSLKDGITATKKAMKDLSYDEIKNTFSGMTMPSA